MSILIGGTGEWSDELNAQLVQRGIRPFRAATDPEIRALLPRLRPAVTILGPELANHEVVRCYVDACDTVPGTRVLVAIDGTDLDFARDLMTIGVPFLAVVPNSLHSLVSEAVMSEMAATREFETDVQVSA